MAVPLLAAAAAAAAILLGSGSSQRSPADASGQPVTGGLDPVPTNHVEGLGDVRMRLDGTVATVTVTTSGLLDPAPHPMHIHAGGRGICPAGTAAKRHNGRLAISTLDGVPFYGPPVTSLTTRGDTSTDSILALRRFPTAGKIRYTRRIRLSPVVVSYVRNDNAVIVVHGADYNHNGVYDSSLDRSDLKRSLPGELTTPALCGRLVAGKDGADSRRRTAQAPSAQGSPRAYVASLGRDTGDVGGGGLGPRAWLCHLGDTATGGLGRA